MIKNFFTYIFVFLFGCSYSTSNNEFNVNKKSLTYLIRFLDSYEESIEKPDNQDNFVKLRLCQINPYSGYSKVISVTKLDENYEFYIKFGCPDTKGVFRYNISSFDDLKLNWDKIIKRSSEISNTSNVEFNRGKSNWSIEFIQKDKYHLNVFQAENMFEIPYELDTLINLILLDSIFPIDSLRKVNCKNYDFYFGSDDSKSDSQSL